MAYLPDRGDIVWIDFDPSSGKEIMKRRPALVLSNKKVNKLTRLAILAPITSGEKKNQLTVELQNVKTKGCVLVYQIKAMDFDARKIKLIEKVSSETIDRVCAIAKLIIS